MDHMNDPRLNKPKGTCAPSGRFKRCKNSYRLYDMVGNLHEWTAAPGGTFRGGYYLDVQHQRRRLQLQDHRALAEVPRLLDGLSLLREPLGLTPQPPLPVGRGGARGSTCRPPSPGRERGWG